MDANIDEVWLSHDNWNGGIDTYNIVLKIPTDLFKSLKRRNAIEQAEAELYKCYADAMRGEGESLQIASVIIRPTTADVTQLGNNYNDRMWKPGYFRLFISHLSEHKESASNLKECLQNFGIDGFVAHEDITPSKEWEQEIEAALFSLDALCAIVAPAFKNSNWCDQEVGIALGRKKMVFPIKKGRNPYGFFGKYQALPNQRNANDMAQELTKAICVNEFTRDEYFTKLVNLVLNASSETTALKFIQVLSEAVYMDKQYVSLLHDNFASNLTIMKENVLEAVNPLFQKYGLNELQIVIPSNNQGDDIDLPF
ncbi:toll/interleukin-1 receptor domain-containing protein [Prevotella sp. khp7]|uniref:toll/interleukin-1 receptor domain-containing protein n=1 Tax=Prevotella sp. khp7 TaxID=1761885 RepID=UPI0015A64E55|nr:toll/interleukin-1 receptor domain-containing protein [Prevotella sp. khp7]